MSLDAQHAAGGLATRAPELRTGEAGAAAGNGAAGHGATGNGAATGQAVANASDGAASTSHSSPSPATPARRTPWAGVIGYALVFAGLALALLIPRICPPWIGRSALVIAILTLAGGAGSVLWHFVRNAL